MVASDRVHYQTVYAQVPGAVAAPTAGLHFTDALLKRLAQKGVEICPLTLHVGPGTFRPISADTLAGHRMHAEWGASVRRPSTGSPAAVPAEAGWWLWERRRSGCSRRRRPMAN